MRWWLVWVGFCFCSLRRHMIGRMGVGLGSAGFLSDAGDLIKCFLFIFSFSLVFSLTPTSFIPPLLFPPSTPALCQFPHPGRDDHAGRQRASDAAIHPRGRGGEEGRRVVRQAQEVQGDRRRLGAHHEGQRRRRGRPCPRLMVVMLL